MRMGSQRVIYFCLLALWFRWTAADGFMTWSSSSLPSPLYRQHPYVPCRHNKDMPMPIHLREPSQQYHLLQFHSHHPVLALSLFKPISMAAASSLLRGGGAGGGGTSSAAASFAAMITHALDSISESKAKCWAMLLMAIAVEAFAVSMSKHARDIKSIRLFASACVLYLFTMTGFNISLSKISVGVAYAAWSALGTLLVTSMGILFFKESFSPFKLLCLSFIVFGVVGLNLKG